MLAAFDAGDCVYKMSQIGSLEHQELKRAALKRSTMVYLGKNQWPVMNAQYKRTRFTAAD
jgi:hypothetical protein